MVILCCWVTSLSTIDLFLTKLQGPFINRFPNKYSAALSEVRWIHGFGTHLKAKYGTWASRVYHWQNVPGALSIRLLASWDDSHRALLSSRISRQNHGDWVALCYSPRRAWLEEFRLSPPHSVPVGQLFCSTHWATRAGFSGLQSPNDFKEQHCDQESWEYEGLGYCVHHSWIQSLVICYFSFYTVHQSALWNSSTISCLPGPYLEVSYSNYSDLGSTNTYWVWKFQLNHSF